MKRALSLVVLAVSFAAFVAPDAHAERLAATVTLGSTTTGSVAAPGAVSTLGFLVTQGTGRALSIQVKRAKGSKLEPEVRLVAPDGTVADLAALGGSVKATATSWTAKLATVPQSGLWRVEVRGTRETTGGFTAAVKAKDAFKYSGTLTIPAGGKQEITLEAGDGAALSVAASRAGPTEVIAQLTILDANGAVVPGGTFTADPKGKLSVKGFVLPFFGRYTLRFTGKSNTGGGIKYTLTGAMAKTSSVQPIARAGTAVVTEPGFGTALDGSTSLPAGSKPLVYRWSQVAGPLVALSDPTSSQPTFTAPAVETSLVFQLSVSEDGVRSRPSTVDVTVANRPVADAGRSLAVASAAPVTLDGGASFDRRGKGLAFAWRQIPGDTAQVTLTGANTSAPAFTAPAGDHVLHFGLTVDDGSATSYEDVVVVAVGAANASVADAGREQFVPRMASVHLSALGSRTASGVLDGTFAWTQVAGPPVALSGADTPWPSFTAPRGVADMQFRLVVNGAAATADRVAVHTRLHETNLPAPAEITGPLHAASGDVALALAPGTADPEGRPLALRWRQVAGAALTLNGAASAVATATLGAGPDLAVFAAMSNDGLQYGAPDLVSVRNTSFAALPVAVAGANLTTAATAQVALDGGGSARTDGGSAPLTYQWTQVSGQDWFDVAASNAVPFAATTKNPAIKLPATVSSLTPTRTIVMQLVVGDGAHLSRPDFVSVTFTGLPLNGKPQVAITPSTTNPTVGETVQLTGVATDLDGDPMTYRWTQVSGPSTPLSPSNTALVVSFVTADATAPIGFRLVANDGFEDSDAAPVSVVVDRRPIATVLTSPVSGVAGTDVTMDGQTSSDPEGMPLTYAWTQISGAPVTLSGGALDTPAIRFTAPEGAVAFRLVVNDGRQSSEGRVAAFSSSPPPTGSPKADRTNAAYGATVGLAANPGPGGPFTFQWRQINPTGADPVVTLNGPATPTPNFTVPMPTSAPFGINPQATFGLIVKLGAMESSEYTVTVKFFASFNDTTQTQNTIYSIISSNCVSCHTGTSNATCATGVGSGTNASGYGMATAAAFLQNSRAVNSCGGTTTGGPKPVPTPGGGKARLPASGTVGASASSAYLLDRVKGIATPRMPASGTYLSQTDTNFLQDWIDQGVLDN